MRIVADAVSAATDVEIRLTNASAASWGYNPCSSPHLQKREGDAWVDQGVLLIICTMELHLLGAGVEVLPVSNAFVVR